MALKPNIAAGESLVETATGIEATRVFDVTSLSGNASARMYRASLRGGVPAIDEPHPDIPGIVVLRRQIAPLGADGARITVRYGPPSGDAASGPPEIEMAVETVQEETVYDADGNLIQTQYSSIGSAGITLTTKTHKLAVERPSMSVRLMRVLAYVPKAQARDHVGTVNAREWSGFPAKTWLCRGISSTQDTPTRHRVTYEFTYKNSDWRAEITTEVDGIIPDDATITNGIRRVDVYPTSDFSRMGVSF